MCAVIYIYIYIYIYNGVTGWVGVKSGCGCEGETVLTITGWCGIATKKCQHSNKWQYWTMLVENEDCITKYFRMAQVAEDVGSLIHCKRRRYARQATNKAMQTLLPSLSQADALPMKILKTCSAGEMEEISADLLGAAQEVRHRISLDVYQP